VPFVNQHTTVFFDTIRIRSVGTNRHQDYRVLAVQTEIHALLEITPLSLAKLQI
jgi:hypothetical protein